MLRLMCVPRRYPKAVNVFVGINNVDKKGVTKLTRTCGNDMIEAGLLGRADRIASPATQGPVIRIGYRGVIKPAGCALVGIVGGRNVVEVAAAVEGPMEGHAGGAGLDLAN